MNSLVDTTDPLLKAYVKGFVFALLLTIAPFALAMFRLLPEIPTLAVIAVMAVIQMWVHLYYFLHLDLSESKRNNLLSLMFAAVIIVLMAGGTIWILYNLHYRMMM